VSYLGNSALPFNPLATSGKPRDAQRFNGDNTTTTFTLNFRVDNATDLEVFVDNVQQEPLTAYDALANQLIFTEAPPSGTNNIYVVYRNTDSGIFANIPDGSITFNKLANNIRLFTTDNFTGDGGTTTFTLSSDVPDANTLVVAVDGVFQRAPIHYTASNNTITFSSAPPVSSNVHVRHLGFRTTQTVTALPANTTISQPVLESPTVTGTLTATGTGAMIMPVGTTEQRPAAPVTGMFRQNSTTGEPEWYDATVGEWKSFREEAGFSADFLVVAGGGGGGNDLGGGGGAGGYRTSAATSGGGASAEPSLTLLSATNYTVTVGAGGSSATSGSNSVLSSITSLGGGFGGSSSGVAGSGGSGGGGGGAAVASVAGGSGTTSQGFSGGNNFPQAGVGPSGGGGGAGAVGQAASSSKGGNGGAGVASTITGSSVTRAGGGGGGTLSGTGGAAGAGGGGAGGAGVSGTVGTANTGGGGGGDGIAGSGGAAGGSGVVIVRYPDTLTITNPGGGLTFTTASSGGFKVTTFTAGTGNIQFA